MQFLEDIKENLLDRNEKMNENKILFKERT